MRKGWMMWREIAKMMHDDEEEYWELTSEQGYLARTMIARLPDRPDIVAELTGLTPEEVQEEANKVSEAQEMVLYGGFNYNVGREVNIKAKEVDRMEVARNERGRCIMNALEHGLMPDAVQEILGIGDEEVNYWYRKWQRMEGKYDWENENI